MSALKMISPLLDQMAVEKETAANGSRSCYILRSTSGERFHLITNSNFRYCSTCRSRS